MFYYSIINYLPNQLLSSQLKNNLKFIKGFQYPENKAKENNKQLHDMSLAGMDFIRKKQ